jgi:hypothetical protein
MAEIKPEAVADFIPKSVADFAWNMQTGVMILGVVGDDPDAADASHTDVPQITKKAKEGGGIELVPFSAKHEPGVTVRQKPALSHVGSAVGLELLVGSLRRGLG